MSQQKWMLAAALAVLTAIAAVAQSPAPELKTDKDKFSFALGMNYGENFRKQGLELDPALFAQAFAEAFNTGKTSMSDEDMQTVLKAASVAIQKKQAEKAEQAKQDGVKFLAENKTKEGVVTLPSGLEYKILKPGTGEKPTLGDKVACNYKGTLIDGTEFDSSEKHGGPVSLPVMGVIKGLSEALQLMPVGSKWQLFIPSDLAYGAQSPTGIGANATLIFELEPVSIQKAAAPAAAPAASPAAAPPATPATGSK